MGAIARSFADVEKRFVKVDARFDEVRAQFNNVYARFDTIAVLFDLANKRLDVQDRLLGEMLKEVKGFRAEAREDRITIGTLAYNDLQHMQAVETLGNRIKKVEYKFA